MAQLIIQSPLAERLRALAERENRSVDAVLTDMLEHYNSPLSAEETDSLLAASGITLPHPDDDALPPLSPDDERALADEIGRGGSLSSLIIEERSDSP